MLVHFTSELHQDAGTENDCGTEGYVLLAKLRFGQNQNSKNLQSTVTSATAQKFLVKVPPLLSLLRSSEILDQAVCTLSS